MELAQFTLQQLNRGCRQIADILFFEAKPQSVNQPTGILLGGQPAAGKTALIRYIQERHTENPFVVVNGDEFRAYHPNYIAIYERYGTDAPHHTQPFSNALVKWAKAECIANRYNFIIEGTMRNFAVIEQTVSRLKAANNRAELHALAIPRIESLLGIFDRHERDMTLTGQGCFSAIAIHDEAYYNIPLNLQRAARELPVDRIVVYQRDLANETVTCLDTQNLTDLTTIDFAGLFAQIRQPQRDTAFYQARYTELLQSAQHRGETSATYLSELEALGTQIE